MFLRKIGQYFELFPDYVPGVLAAGAVLLMAVPIYLALWYFLYRRKMVFPWRLQFGVIGIFVLFAGLAFAFGAPFATQASALLRAYLFITCLLAAYCIVALCDIFFIQHYLIAEKKVYISPPLQKVINFGLFCLVLLPILRYVLKFNPFTLIAIPTIVTAGIALALQDTMKAFIAGINLGHFLHIGDWVSFQDREGRVVDINWGRTVLRTVDGDLLLVPNTVLISQPFINYSTHRSHRMTLKIGVAYTASPERVKAAMKGCAENVDGILPYPEPKAQVVATAESAITYALYYWIEDYGQRAELQDVLATRLWTALKKEEFEVVYPFATYTINEGFHPPSRVDGHKVKTASKTTSS